VDGGPAPVLGAVLAGGRSRRFRGPKALAELGGRKLTEWPLSALEGQVGRVVLVADDPALARALGVASRGDAVPGRGPVGGLVTALWWAREEGLGDVFLLGCDMPLVTRELVAELLARRRTGEAVLPESAGPLGFEPLCAVYSTSLLEEAERCVQEGHPAFEDLLERVPYRIVPAAELPSLRDRPHAFLNVNTRDDLARAEVLLRALAGRGG